MPQDSETTMRRIKELIKQPQHIRLLHESCYIGLFVCLFLGVILPTTSISGTWPTTNHKTLRITLKQIKESLDELPVMVQCHRAFIVNLNFVISITNRSSGFQLQLFGTERQIPVSRSFNPLVKEKLQPAHS